MSGSTAEPDLQQNTDCAFQADVHMERGKNGYRCVKSSDVGFNCRTRPTTRVVTMSGSTTEPDLRLLSQQIQQNLTRAFGVGFSARGTHHLPNEPA